MRTSTISTLPAGFFGCFLPLSTFPLTGTEVATFSSVSTATYEKFQKGNMSITDVCDVIGREDSQCWAKQRTSNPHVHQSEHYSPRIARDRLSRIVRQTGCLVPQYFIHPPTTYFRFAGEAPYRTAQLNFHTRITRYTCDISPVAITSTREDNTVHGGHAVRPTTPEDCSPDESTLPPLPLLLSGPFFPPPLPSLSFFPAGFDGGVSLRGVPSTSGGRSDICERTCECSG